MNFVFPKIEKVSSGMDVDNNYSYGMENIRVMWPNPYILKIGKFCSFANDIEVYCGGNHDTTWITTFPFGHTNQHKFNVPPVPNTPKSNGDVVIKDNVWVGAHVRIMSGVTIGEGAVIANSSHVVKDVQPYSIVGGNPAKFIKYRFSEDQISDLLKINWVNWSDEKIKENISLLCSNDIQKFIDLHKI